jgi:hypothetical protein
MPVLQHYFFRDGHMFKSTHTPIVTLFAASCLLAGPAIAHEAHVHGVANMDITVDAQQLTFQLHTPLANLIGFEHTPSTDRDRQAVRDMATRLRTPNAAFVTPAGAACTLSTVTLAADNMPADLLGEAPKKEVHQHGKKDDHDKHGHSHDHQHDHKHAQAHADLDATFIYTCGKVQQLHYIDVPLVTTFKGITRLETQIVTQERQMAVTLGANTTRIQLK